MNLLKLALFYGLLRYLPTSNAPALGPMFRRLRYLGCRSLFSKCGTNVNIEHGAHFGSGRDISIGDNSGIGVSARLFGPVVMGNDVMMGPDVIVFTQNHNMQRTNLPMAEQGMGKVSPVVIEDDVWIGARAILLPGVRIGRGSVIGAGTVVSKDIAPYSVVVGCPQRVVRVRGEIV